ncbi:MAG: valine--tRNA ligase [Alphaproteobacteria bacterium]|nr:valine--tRNA ligase [Alphaproteobacteria bacterium]
MSSGELPGAYDAAAAAEKWSTAWDEAGIFTADPEAPGEPFSIVIPPPNVTGRLHMGHALNNTIQDVLIRYKRMDGFNVLWVPGTDHAGIATQWVVRRQLQAEGIDMFDLGREAFLERVWAWKEQTSGAIQGQLKRLGVSCDWSRERFTLDPGLADAVTEHFVQLYEQGLIYRGERLVNWDPVDQTAVSDLEVEYKKDAKGQTEKEKGELFHFAYPLSDGTGEIVVATTRPETMLGDTAVAVHPDDPRYQHLLGKTVRHPFLDREIPIVGDAILVDPEFGTGAVKITPAHDFNDFEVGKRHGLPMINILERDGRINAVGGPSFAGLDRFEARAKVKDELEALGLHRGVDEHWLPIGRSQRSGAVIEPMLSTQWFVSMKPLAGPSLAAVEQGFTRFVPKMWENTYFSWLRDIRDWCISRQLWWGHRIPAWYCEACGEVHVARAAPEACSACGHAALRQDDDVLDTWFSSALWPFSTMGWPERTADLAKYYPTSVLVTAFDIIFFWVARMMFAGQHLTGSVPFKDVYIHALIRDEHRQKMSKTKGNVVDPLSVIDEAGADAFRFTLMALAAQGRDIVWDPSRVGDSGRFLTKMWQAMRFGYLHIEGYDPSGPMEPGVYEAWIQARTGQAVARVRSALDAYKFNEAASEIHAFVWGEFCDWYLELSKTTLYDEAASPARKNATKHALFTTLGVIARLLHPFIPHFSEEMWSRLPGTQGFVAVAAYPREVDFPSDPAVLDEVAKLQEAISAVRNIRGEMELSPKVQLTLLVDSEAVRTVLDRHRRTMQGPMAHATVQPLVERPALAATAVIVGSEALIPLEGIVDVAAEVDRLAKELVKVRKDVAQLTSRLGNPAFVDRAPAELVAEFQGKLDAARTRLDLLERNHQRLSGAS